MRPAVVNNGEQFGRLVVVREVEKVDGRRRFLCKCECGTEKSVAISGLRSGKTKSCGCSWLGVRPSKEPDAVPGARWIPVTQNKWALVDECDYERLASLRWSFIWNRYAMTYKKSNGTETRTTMHRSVLGDDLPDGMVVDHINNDGLDNRRANLRVATRQQNNMNKGAYKNRKYKGVYPCRDKWQAKIRRGDVRKFLGVFETEEAAAAAYNRAAIELFGDFAWTNVVGAGD